MKLHTVFLSICVVSILGCVKKPVPEVPNDTTPIGKVSIEMEHVFADKPLSLDNTWYTTEYGDSIKITTYKYYLSNIKLISKDGKSTAEPYSYHLIDQSKKASLNFDVDSLQPGTYSKLQFLIGVDSARNVSGAQTGDLDPKYNMFWDWSTGYIMSMLEGESPQSTNATRWVGYHLGGFKEEFGVLKTVTVDFPKEVTITENGTVEIHMEGDVSEWFKTPKTISINKLSNLLNTGGSPKQLADNYVDMFTVKHVD